MQLPANWELLKDKCVYDWSLLYPCEANYPRGGKQGLKFHGGLSIFILHHTSNKNVGYKQNQIGLMSSFSLYCSEQNVLYKKTRSVTQKIQNMNTSFALIISRRSENKLSQLIKKNAGKDTTRWVEKK